MKNKSIADIDANFALPTGCDRENLKEYDAASDPFSVCGLMVPSVGEDYYRRMPEEDARKVSPDVFFLNKNTSGGRLVFSTNSGYIGIKAEMHCVMQMSHFSMTGASGFDLYMVKDGAFVYISTFVPPIDLSSGFSFGYEITGKREMRTYVLHFPLYCGVKKLGILLEDDADVESASIYKNTPPLCFTARRLLRVGVPHAPATAIQT